MTKDNLLEHLRFHYWATGKLLDACEGLSEEALERDVGGSFGSLFATLVHMYSADNIWLARWQGVEGVGFSSVDEFASVRDLRNAWQLKGEDILLYVGSANVSEVMTILDYKFALWEMLVHMIDHSSFHRGQVINMLRNEGLEPPSTNFIHYLREQQLG